MNRPLKLIIFSGLPGSGKSTMADFASKEFAWPVIAKDWVEAALWRNNIRKENNSGSIAYDILTALAQEQLKRGVSVIIDSVAPSLSIRKTWEDLATQYSAEFIVIECVCSNESLHRKRLEVRKRNIEGWPELTWDDVLETKARYTSWGRKRLVLDSVNNLEENIRKVADYLKE